MKSKLLLASRMFKEMIYDHSAILREQALPHNELVFLGVYFQVIDETIYDDSGWKDIDPDLRF